MLMLEAIKFSKVRDIISKAYDYIELRGFKDVYIQGINWDDKELGYVVSFYTDYDSFSYINVWVYDCDAGFSVAGHNLNSEPYT